MINSEQKQISLFRYKSFEKNEIMDERIDSVSILCEFIAFCGRIVA